MFVLGIKSKKNLSGVKSRLQNVVKMALQFSQIDFAVLEGLRSVDRQKILVKSGASKTMASKHLTGDAVDLGAYVDKEIRWDWELYYKIAEAMQKAAIKLNVKIVWGGVWDRNLNDLVDLKAEVKKYCARHKGVDFLDGPHFQLAD